MQQPLLTVETSHNRGKYVRGERYRTPLSVFMDVYLCVEKFLSLEY